MSQAPKTKMVYCVPTRNICKNMIAKTVIPTEAMILVTKQLMHKGNIMRKKQSIRYLLLTCLAGGLLLGMADSASAEPRSNQRGGCLADPEISALILNGDYQGWRSWLVISEQARWRGPTRAVIGEPIRVIGEREDTETFIASEIRPWPGRRARARTKLSLMGVARPGMR